MQQSQRAEMNPALEHAIRMANAADVPLVVAFGVTDGFPDANRRHYAFMLEGLAETRASLADRGIALVTRRGPPSGIALDLGGDAAFIVCDRGYLRVQKVWREQVAAEARCPVVEVEGDVVVPVDVASDKAEYAARTIRPKIERRLDEYIVGLRTTAPAKESLRLGIDGLSLDDVDAILDDLDIDQTVPPVGVFFRGGTSEAKKRLRGFLSDDLPVYDETRNQPQTDHVSHLAKYLHFGQISPVYVALQARGADADRAQKKSFLEELIVRRELAQNFVAFTKDYDRWRMLPDWSRKTLEKHRSDERENVYTRDELHAAETHDRYWNAAMREMKYTGYMHNHMRMYWGKKIIEWTNTPEYAYRVICELNNRYFLDGRDANSWANIGWLFGLHDRPWQEREIFGTVRYMSAGGLERKTKPDEYVAKVDKLVEEAKRAGIVFPGD
jgi:deoxyribodipyrimidine photo-lyase